MVRQVGYLLESFCVTLQQSAMVDIFAVSERVEGEEEERERLLGAARGEEKKINEIYQHALFGAIGCFQSFIQCNFTASQLVYSFLL